MANQYISRFSKFDTHFQRVDPWKHTPFYETSKTVIASSFYGLCFIAFLVLMIFILLGAA